jgi:hypothetical protein
MKLRLLIIPALMASALFAQGQGFGGRRGTNRNANTQSQVTPAQLAARQLQMVASFLHLDSDQTSALMQNTALLGLLTTEETTLEANSATLKIEYSTLATQLIGAPSATPAELSAIEGLITTDLQLRVTAAGEIVSALQNLSPALSTQQSANLPRLIGVLVGGGSQQ